MNKISINYFMANGQIGKAYSAKINTEAINLTKSNLNWAHIVPDREIRRD